MQAGAKGGAKRMLSVMGDGRGGRAQLQLLHPPQEWKEKQLQRSYACRMAQNGDAKRMVSVSVGMARWQGSASAVASPTRIERKTASKAARMQAGAKRWC